MQVFHNIFSSKQLELVESSLANCSNQRVNSDIWDSKLYHGFSGSVHVYSVNHWVRNSVVRCFQRLLPNLDTSRSVVQYCIWNHSSGINPHRDSRYSWAATVYLCKSWVESLGGIFYWEDHCGQCYSHLPVYNSLVVNDFNELHWVSSVKSDFYQRRTLQIWANP